MVMVVTGDLEGHHDANDLFSEFISSSEYDFKC